MRLVLADNLFYLTKYDHFETKGMKSVTNVTLYKDGNEVYLWGFTGDKNHRKTLKGTLPCEFDKVEFTTGDLYIYEK